MVGTISYSTTLREWVEAEGPTTQVQLCRIPGAKKVLIYEQMHLDMTYDIDELWKTCTFPEQNHPGRSPCGIKACSQLGGPKALEIRGAELPTVTCQHSHAKF